MDSNQQKIGKAILTLSLLFVAFTSFCQKVVVTISADKKDVPTDERITITVTSNIQGNIQVDYPNEFAVDMGLMHGMEQKMDASGKIVSMYYVQQSGSFSKEGNYSLTATLTHHNKTYKSNKITIQVAETNREDFSTVRSNDPIFGLIQSQKNSVYEGEPVVLQAKVFSFLDINFMEGYVPFKPSSTIEKHDFPNKKVNLEQTKVNGKNALTFEYGKQVFIPISTGKCIVKPFEMALRCSGSIFAKTYRIRSSGLSIDVKPLPNGAPASFIGAVGTYQLQQKNPVGSIRENDVVTLELTLSGSGNLHNSNAPKLNLPKGCSIYGDPEKVDQYTFTENGAEGSITYRYNIQVNASGKIHFSAPVITYFDPQKETYVTIRGTAFDVEAKPNSNVIVKQDVDTQSETENAITPNSSPAATNVSQHTGNTWLTSYALPTGIISLLFILFLMRRKIKAKKPCLTPGKCRDMKVEEIALCKDQPVVEAPIVLNTTYWQDALAVQNNPAEFAVLFPKAILERYSKIVGTPFNTRDTLYIHLAGNAPNSHSTIKELIEECDRFRFDISAPELNCQQVIQAADLELNAIEKSKGKE